MHRDQHFRHLMNTVPVLIWCTDLEGRAVFFNRTWTDFIGKDAPADAWLTSLHDDDAPARAALAQSMILREPIQLEFRLRRADGEWRWMLCNATPLPGPGRAFSGYLGVCTDTTEVKHAQEHRERMLEEKAAVMQELHHRVKNNAQVFSSLLAVQASRAQEPAVKAALRAAAARAATMATAQQQIWETGSPARFDLVALVHRLIRAIPPNGNDVELRAPATLLVPLSIAVPLGLILHELLLNALTHAFPGETRGSVVVGVLSHGEGRLRLCVADNGAGLGDAVESGKFRSAGLTIVRSLARQIGATLTTEVGSGTRVKLDLPCELPS